MKIKVQLAGVLSKGTYSFPSQAFACFGYSIVGSGITSLRYRSDADHDSFAFTIIAACTYNFVKRFFKKSAS